jgi:hypothetical protein
MLADFGRSGHCGCHHAWHCGGCMPLVRMHHCPLIARPLSTRTRQGVLRRGGGVGGLVTGMSRGGLRGGIR